MATTVIAAFNEFMKDTVNLEKADTDDARASRDWLIGKINDFENDEVFPVSYPGIHIAFGSFARRTKIRPLDDIDLMFGLTGQGATYTILSDRVTVTSSGEGSRLHRYRHSGADTVCSVRILNAFKNRLQDIAQYAQADIRRNQEAVTLKLVSKDCGLAPIFPYTFYHLTHYWFAAADIPVANDTPVHYADAIRCNVRRPPRGSLPLLTRRVSA